jgi:predicted  nucleic acid-binding Zn-ribbon protein
MSIYSINNIKTNNTANLSADLTAIACLDEKIQTVAQRIIAANQELNSVKTELRQIKPKVDDQELKSYGFSEESIAFMKKVPSEHQDRASELKTKKDALKTLVAANHEYLTHYEQKLKKCIAAFDKAYPNYRIDQISAKVALAQAERKDIMMDVSLSQGRGVSLTQMGPSSTVPWQERAERIFERALSYQGIKDLYLEAMLAPYPKTGETGPWKLWLAKNNEPPLSCAT